MTFDRIFLINHWYLTEEIKFHWSVQEAMWSLLPNDKEGLFGHERYGDWVQLSNATQNGVVFG